MHDRMMPMAMGGMRPGATMAGAGPMGGPGAAMPMPAPSMAAMNRVQPTRGGGTANQALGRRKRQAAALPSTVGQG